MQHRDQIIIQKVVSEITIGISLLGDTTLSSEPMESYCRNA